MPSGIDYKKESFSDDESESVGKILHPRKGLSHTSGIERANHSANFYNDRNGARTSSERNMRSDDVVNFELLRTIEDSNYSRGRSVVNKGGLAYEEDKENLEFFDRQSGKRYKIEATKLSRPDTKLKSSGMSLKGRGIIKGAPR